MFRRKRALGRNNKTGPSEEFLARICQRHAEGFASLGEHISSSDRALRKNHKKTLKRFLAIAGDLDRVTIDESGPQSNSTVRLVDSKGNETTIWINKATGEVRDITPY